MLKVRLDLRNVVKTVACLAESKVMSSGNFFKKVCVILSAVSSIILSSCSSPEKDGVKAAQKLCDCVDERGVNDKKARELYIKNFGSYSFKTRIEARETLNEISQKVQEGYYECVNKANTYREELGSKYHTNKEYAEKYQYAYNAHQNAFNPKEIVYEFDYNERINSLILKIIPPKPDFERLKKDLIGRTFYYNTVKGWLPESISLEKIQEVRILNTNSIGDDYFLLVYLDLYKRPGYLDFGSGNINVTYRLGNNDDWFIVNFRTEE